MDDIDDILEELNDISDISDTDDINDIGCELINNYLPIDCIGIILSFVELADTCKKVSYISKEVYNYVNCNKYICNNSYSTLIDDERIIMSEGYKYYYISKKKYVSHLMYNLDRELNDKEKNDMKVLRYSDNMTYIDTKKSIKLSYKFYLYKRYNCMVHFQDVSVKIDRSVADYKYIDISYVDSKVKRVGIYYDGRDKHVHYHKDKTKHSFENIKYLKQYNKANNDLFSIGTDVDKVVALNLKNNSIFPTNYLNSFTGLRYLDMTQYKYDRSMRNVMSRLTCLVINGSYKKCNFLTYGKNLLLLDVSKNDMVENNHISGLTKLRYLNINECPHLYDNCIKSMINLKHFYINDHITDRTLRGLKDCNIYRYVNNYPRPIEYREWPGIFMDKLVKKRKILYTPANILDQILDGSDHIDHNF